MKIEFKKDFATKKKGEVWDNCPNMLGANLIARGVAKKHTRKAARPKTEDKNAAPKTEDK